METVKSWTKEAIAEKLATDPKWLYRGLLAIYDRQTADEKRDDQTRHENGVGFNGSDAMLLSSFARFLKRTGYLSPKQTAIAQRKMRKYAGQLAKIANGKM